MKCSNCRRKFPDHLINEMAVSMHGNLKYKSVCPLCALAITNHLHGLSRTRFDGPQAQMMLEEAKLFLERSASK